MQTEMRDALNSGQYLSIPNKTAWYRKVIECSAFYPRNPKLKTQPPARASTPLNRKRKYVATNTRHNMRADVIADCILYPKN